MKKLLITTALVLSTSAAFASGDTQDNVLGANNVYNAEVNNSNQGNTTVTHADGSGNTTTVEAITPNGYVSNPNLTTGGSDVCLGSSSAGISAAGIGISGGSTTIDENCVMLKNAKILASLGLKDAAVTLLIISNEKAAEAISLANPELFKTLTNTQ